MYHGIENVESTEYVGGNVDKDGYNRTVEAFKNDLEFYYKEGYRMVRLEDYVNGKITTELGKSPIILTFDDGNKNNFNVLGKDEDGNLKSNYTEDGLHLNSLGYVVVTRCLLPYLNE